MLIVLGELRSSPGSVSFDHRSGRLVNQGSTPRTLILWTGDEKAHLDAPPGGASDHPAGDRRFLDALPPELVEIGTELLGRVRQVRPGELRLYPDSQRYVDDPDNFWTVKIQRQDHSLRVTVRGEPDYFGETGNVDLRNDRHGYSTFKVGSMPQVAAAADVILRARQGRRSRRR